MGAMKGVILSINPEATIVDISHEISPQDIQAAAFNLFCCYDNFPAGTIHVAVVDPGVGSDRKPVAIECGQRFFVGPDNGLFSWICEREREWRAFQLTNSQFFRQPVSHTFHGRDIFAPIAAVLSKGVAISELGEAVADIVRLETIEPRRLNDGTIEGRIIHIDRFGNCITNLTNEFVSGASRLLIGNHKVTSFLNFFAEARRDDDFFCVVGSAGFLEIATRNASAASILSVKRGQPVKLELSLQPFA